MVRAGLREAVLLSLLMAFGRGPSEPGSLVQNSPDYFVLVVLPCSAMGIQSASLQRVGSVGVRTTFITGILTGLGEELVAALYGLRARRQAIDRGEAVEMGPALEGTLQRAALFAGIWAAYFVGGVLAGVGLQLWQLNALALPVLGLAALAVLDLVHPIQPGRG